MFRQTIKPLRRLTSGAFLLLIAAGCASNTTQHRYPVQHSGVTTLDKPVQCVLYARDVSGISIYGNAHRWWKKAAALRYERGVQPKPGAVLVLARTRTLPYGHLAVVKRVIDNRHIEVAHSNWGHNKATRRKLYHSMRVKDISRKNDWSRLRFWHYDSESFGNPYVAKGFIYNQKKS